MANPAYVNDGGSNTSPYDTWAKAATNLATALSAAAAGDTIYVDSTHAETPGATTLSNSGTNAAPIIIISVDATGSPEPPTTGDYLAGASLTVTGAGLDLSFPGHAVSYGVNYTAPDNLQGGNDANWEFHDCTMALSGTSADFFYFPYADCVFSFIDVEFSFGATTQGFALGGGSSLYFRGITIDGTATKPNQLVSNAGSPEGTTFIVEDSDLSNLATSADIFGALPSVSAGQNSVYRAANCLLPTSGTITNETVAAKGAVVEAFNCSATASDDRGYYVQTIFGTVNNDTSVYLDTDNDFSLQMVTSSDAVRGLHPLRCMLGEVYAAAGATISVQGIIDSATLPDDDEFYIEVVYPKVAVLPYYQTATSLHGHGDTGLSNDWFVASTTALSAGTTGWTGVGGFTNTGEFTASINLSATTPTSAAGVVQVWVNYAAPSSTVYVDSKITVA